MTVLQNSKDFIFTKGDTFDVKFTPTACFLSGNTVEFVISKSENAEPTILKTISCYSGQIDVEIILAAEETQIFDFTTYLWKFVINSASGIRETSISGNFKVVWGDGKDGN